MLFNIKPASFLLLNDLAINDIDLFSSIIVLLIRFKIQAKLLFSSEFKTSVSNYKNVFIETDYCQRLLITIYIYSNFVT